MRKTLKGAALAAVLLLLGSSAWSQVPRLRRASGSMQYLGTLEMRNLLMYGTFTTVRTVCPTDCDYTNIPDAITYVSGQTRSIYQQWTILIYGGESASATPNMNYTVSSLSVPSWTTIAGYPAGHPVGSSINATPQPVIELTATTGVQLTFGEGAGCQSLNFYTNATLTGNTVMAKTTGGDAVYLANCQFWGNAATGANSFDILEAAATQTIGFNVSTVRGQNGSSATVRNVLVSAGTVTLFGARHQPGQGTSQAKTVEITGGSLALNWTRLLTGATVALTVTGGSATNRFSDVPSYSGAVTMATLYAPNSSTLPATCSVGSLYVDTTSGAARQCFCSAANTWTCNAGALTAASAPYTCDAGHAGGIYVDTTTPSLCFCTGSAWVTTVAGGNCS